MAVCNKYILLVLGLQYSTPPGDLQNRATESYYYQMWYAWGRKDSITEHEIWTMFHPKNRAIYQLHYKLTYCLVIFKTDHHWYTKDPSTSFWTYYAIWRHRNGSTLPQAMLVCSLQWRHSERDGVSNLQLHDCLIQRLFRCRSKKTPKLRIADLCKGNSPVTGEFPAQRASNAQMLPFDDVSILPGSKSISDPNSAEGDFIWSAQYI